MGFGSPVNLYNLNIFAFYHILKCMYTTIKSLLFTVKENSGKVLGQRKALQSQFCHWKASKSTLLSICRLFELYLMGNAKY